MKTRNGFVSNSSSTSFIIAVKKTETAKCSHCGASPLDCLTALEIRMGNHRPDFSRLNVDDYIGTQGFELDDLEKDKKWATDRITELKQLQKDKDAMVLADKIAELLIRSAGMSKSDIRNSRCGKEYITGRSKKGGTGVIIGDRIESLCHGLDNINKEIEDKKNILKNLMPLKDKNWALINIRVNDFDSDMVESIELMVEKKIVKIIKEERD